MLWWCFTNNNELKNMYNNNKMIKSGCKPSLHIISSK